MSVCLAACLVLPRHHRLELTSRAFPFPVRARAQEKDASHPLLKSHIRIASVNNFPTAAGLASSAAGYACLVASLANLFGVTDTELTAIAR